MRGRMLSALLLTSAMALVGCDKNKATSATDTSAPAGGQTAGTLPPPPEPVTYDPAPTPAPSVTFSDTGSSSGVTGRSGGTYVVQKGDTLWKIAQKVYGDGKKVKEISAANNITDPNKIKVGQKLILP